MQVMQLVGAILVIMSEAVDIAQLVFLALPCKNYNNRRGAALTNDSLLSQKWLISTATVSQRRTHFCGQRLVLGAMNSMNLVITTECLIYSPGLSRAP